MRTVHPGPPLQVRNLRKAYKDVVAVDGLDLEVHSRECFGLLGPNGAGKTTTIEICEGLNTPDAGEVLVLGRRWGENDRELRELLGISLQETQFSEKLTVEETLHLFRSFYREGASPESVIAMVQLQEKTRSRVGTLSGGQKQRLALACALVGDPEFLFLDEPTTGLDPQVRLEIHTLIEELKAAKRTVLLTTHYIEEAERLCDRVAIIDQGKIVALGSPRELQERVFGQSRIEVVTAQPMLGELPTFEAVAKQALSDDCKTLVVHSTRPARTLPDLIKWIDQKGFELEDIHLKRPTLEDVFIELTGKKLRD